MEKNSGEGKAKENMHLQGYGLRGNPKKSWKSLGFVDSCSASEQRFPCRVCGKQFEAMKALFGHMRHHSRKERKTSVSCQECGRKFQSLRALTGHMRLHTVKLRVSGESGCGGARKELVFESITVRRNRSKRVLRYSYAPNSSLSSLNESSGVVEIDHEVEDVALCLMMLSKGVRSWSAFNSFRESLDNNPDSSEINSVHRNKEILQINENENPFCDEDESFQMKKERVDKSDSVASASMDVSSENKISECEELDSGILAYKEKKIGSEAAHDTFYRGVDFRVSKLELYDAKTEERISGEIMTSMAIEVESGQDLMEGTDLVGLAATELSSCKDAMSDACGAQTGGDSLNNLIWAPFNSEMPDDFLKKNKCRICNKTFKSHQALGGHQTSHRKSNSCAVEQFENCENSTQGSSSRETESGVKLMKKVEYVENSAEQEMDGVTSYDTKMYKEHRCQICFKVFASGQALGGHKRSHISETRGNQPEKQLEFSNICDVIDHSLPAMHNEEANGDFGLKSSRVGSDCKSEQLVSPVAN